MKEVSGRFFEKKLRKKLFCSFGPRAVSTSREAEQKSFLLLFFKKEALVCL